MNLHQTSSARPTLKGIQARNISFLKQFKSSIRKADLTQILDTNLVDTIPFAPHSPHKLHAYGNDSNVNITLISGSRLFKFLYVVT